MRLLPGPAFTFLFLFGALPALAAERAKEIRVGILGLDAHGLPFTQILNGPNKTGDLAKLHVGGGLAGERDVPASREILGQSVEPVRKLGVEILDSVNAVLRKSDAVLILSTASDFRSTASTESRISTPS